MFFLFPLLSYFPARLTDGRTAATSGQDPFHCCTRDRQGILYTMNISKCPSIRFHMYTQWGSSLSLSLLFARVQLPPHFSYFSHSCQHGHWAVVTSIYMTVAACDDDFSQRYAGEVAGGRTSDLFIKSHFHLSSFIESLMELMCRITWSLFLFFSFLIQNQSKKIGC